MMYEFYRGAPHPESRRTTVGGGQKSGEDVTLTADMLAEEKASLSSGITPFKAPIFDCTDPAGTGSAAVGLTRPSGLVHGTLMGSCKHPGGIRSFPAA